MEKVTVLVNSCDLYIDTWNPQIELWYIQWPDCPYNIVINTETKEYHNEKFPLVSTFCSGEGLTWSQRFRKVVSHIDTEFILFTIDDYFIQKPVNTEVFEYAVNLMGQNKNIGMICLAGTNKQGIKTDAYEDDYFWSRVIDKHNLIWCRTCLYRKDYLLKLIRDHETIWEFESFCSYRAKRLPYIILQENSNHEETFTFKVKHENGYGVSGKKWLPKNVELFERYGIEVNYDGLGIRDFTKPIPAEEQSKEKKGSKTREFLYRFKQELKAEKKKIVKFIRKLKSMI